ncbi:Succinyl-CoA:(R)-benzylsuccinate CoA-transferase subunit BbsF [Nymphon striatum]|nr:Succinyl-CoA:(R)-benzylsuccinate CoA-transferase subunit BbsF [Nymphon striatum]
MLAPYRVLDLTDARAESATFMLAGLGADVIKVEPPTGATSREDELAFVAYNRGKRSVALDLEDPRDKEAFLKLVATADFVFENSGPGVLDELGLGFEALKEVRPDVVYVAISPFGQTGPYADHAATDLTIAAMGGSMALNGTATAGRSSPKRRSSLAHSSSITLVPVNTASDTVDMEQLATRNYWDEAQLPGGRTARVPGPFVKVSNAPIAWGAATPGVGEHTEQIMTNVDNERRPRPAVRAQERRLPLEGVRVADFSWIGVGPITAKSLADHGATVVRIESMEPADRLRLVGPFKDGVPGINRCQFFGSFNTSKKSIQLDLKNPVGRDVAQRLLSWCDIALDSFTAGTMDRLGLGYETARELNPDIIMATTCLFGQTGPISNLAGYGYHAAAISGFYEITGWADRPPGGPWNAYTDTVAPRFLTTTLLAALDHRRRTGQGQYIDQAQMESALHFQSPQLLDVQLSGHSARRNGNFDAEMAPHDSYRCAGDDQWCAIAIENEAQWQELCGVIGADDLAQESELQTAAGRRSHAERIDAAITAFTAQHEPHQVMHLLQEAGVPAGAVQRSSDHLVDPQLEHRNFFPPTRASGDGRGPVRGPSVLDPGLRQRPTHARPMPGRAHVRSAERHSRTERRGPDRGACKRCLRLTPID